jgi:predicted adenylyl cyclase CyaB
MPNTEIELKYKIKNPDEIEGKIKSLGARYIKEFHCVDTYFLVPENKDGKKYLRIRETEDKAEFAFHFAVSSTQTDEWETAIDNAKTTKEILQKIGHKIDVVVEKSRKVYKYRNSEVVVDEVKNLGDFIEIESPGLEELEGIEKQLGFTKSDRIDDRGYPDMIRGQLINK